MDSAALVFLKELGLHKCVFCNSDVSHSKVLGCLHLACKYCAKNNISFHDSITCTRCQYIVKNPGHGYSVVDSLADLPAGGIGVVPSADLTEDGTEYGLQKRPKRSATESSVPNVRIGNSVCENDECKGSDVAANSKCTECSMTLCLGHALVHRRCKTASTHRVLPLNELSNAHDIKCRLHSADDLVKYCSTCEALVCERCLAKNEHVSHDVEEIQTAADRLKGEYEDKMAELASEEVDGDMFLEKEAAAKYELKKAAEQHSTLSAQISDDFQMFRHGLLEREASLKNDVDRKHWMVSKRLDKFTDGVREQHGQLAISQRLVSSLNGINLLRASTPIRNVIKQSIEKAKEPVPACNLDTKYHGFSCIANNLGRLTSKSIGDISNDEGNTIYCLQFDYRRKTDGVKLSRNSQVAHTIIDRKDAEHENPDGSTYMERQTIYGVHYYSTGVVRFKVILLELALNHFVGVATHLSPLAVDPEFLGWGGHDGLVKGTKGGALGLDWQDGDILCLTLYCSLHKLTAVHQRTGETETIDVPAEPLCFNVRLCPVGSAQILPPIAV